MKQSTSFAQVATNLLNLLQGYTKTIRLLLVMFLTLTVTTNAWGADVTISVSSDTWTNTGTSGSGSLTKVSKSGVTVSSDKGYKDGTTAIREYSGGIITVSSSSNITKIVFTSTSSGTSNNGPSKISIKSGGGNYSYSGSNGTWTGTSSTVTFKCNAQFRWKQVVVTTASATTYTVTYNANGGSGTMSNSTGSSIEIKECTFTAPECKQFTSWNTAANGSGTSYAPNATVTTNLTLYAQWGDLPSYTVKLMDNNEVLTSSCNTPITLPSRDGCDGYEFVGWTKSWSVAQTTWTTTAPDIIEAGSYTPTANESLYPVYTKTEGGGTAYEKAATLTEGVYVMVSEKTSGTYKYMPNTTSSGSNPTLGSGITMNSGKTSLTNKITEEMLWDLTTTGTANQYYLRPHGSTTIGLGCTSSTGANIRISTLYKDVKWTITTSSSYGWQFKSNASTAMYLAVYADDNWRNYTSSTTNQNGKFYLFKQTSSSTTSYISVPECTTETSVSFNLNGGSGTFNDVALDGNTYDIPETEPTLNGYNFAGWKIQDGDNTVYKYGTTNSTIQNITADITLVAQWTAKTTSITLDANTSNNGSGTNSSVTATYDQALPEFQACTPTTGYTLNGYYTATTSGTMIIDKEGKFVSDVADYTSNEGKWKNESATLTLYAQYTINSYTVTFDNQEHGIKPDNQTITHGKKVNKPTDLTESGLIFGGWYKEAECINAWDFENDVVTSFITLYAKWTAKTATSLTWSPTSYSATIDADNTFPILTKTPADLSPIAYSSSNTSIATIDANGNITLLKKGETTITATFEETATHTGATDSYTLTVYPSNCRWVETEIGDIKPEDEVVVTMTNGVTTWALDQYYYNDGDKYPLATPLEVNGNEITQIYDEIKWNISSNATDGYILYPNGQTATWLYCTGSNNTVKIGEGTDKYFVIENGYLKNKNKLTYTKEGVEITVDAFLGVSSSTNSWRHYPNTTSVISGQTLKFYKRECLDASKVWVEGNLTNVTSSPQLPQQLAKNGSLELTFTAADSYELPNNVTVTNATKNWDKENGTLIISNPTGNVEITISALQTYTISYDAGSGDGIEGSHDSQTKTHDIDIKLADKCFTRPDYTQTGWSKTDGGQKDYDLLSQFGENANTTLYPYWTKVHTITWMADGSAHDEATYLDGETLALPETDPEACQGSVLVGWTDDEDYFNATTAPTYVTAGSAVKDDATYYAVYAEVTLGEPIKEEITNTYTFSNYTAGTQYATNEEHILDEDVTIYTTQCHFTTELRIYASNTHNGYVESNKLPGNIISIGFNAGENSDNLLVYGSENGSDWNQIGKVAVNSSYKDYTLDFGETDYTYFKLDVEGSSQIRIKSMFITYMRVSEEVSTDYINYSTSCIPTYHVNYELAGGENGCADEGVKVGNDYTICGDEPTKTGYTFQHWTDGTNTYEAGATIENVQSNITLTAVWEAKTYTITWMSNGEEYVTTTHTYDQPLHIADAPYNCYGAKTFMGWTETPSVNENGEGITYIEESTNPSEKKTYYAVFADVEGGSEVENTITLNKDAMGTSNGYSDDEFKVDGITFLRSNWGRQQSGQDYFLQGKSDNAFFNSDEIPGYIKSITINKYGGSGKFYIGTTQSPEDNETEVQNGTNTYTYSKANGYKYIKFLSTSTLKINSISIVCVIGGTEISNYTTTPAGCPEIEVAENAYVTSTSSQSVKVKVPVTISNYQDGISLSASIEGESNFTIANISSITEGTATLEIAYKPTDYNTTENTTVTILTKIGENKVTAADFTITGRSLPEKFAIVAEKDGKYYALPADMPSAGTYAGYEVEVKDNAIVTAPATYVYSLSAVHNSRYADNGTAVRFVGNDNKCLWASKEKDGTNIRNSSQVENAKYDQYEWNLSTTDGERYTISSSVVADAERILRLYNQKFGMYKDGVSAFYFLPLMASTEDAKVLSSAFSVSATEKVQFSAGNLQYHTGDKAWRFAEQQYYYVGDNNKNISNPEFKDWIDMFGWSADGKFGVNTSIDNNDYQGEFVDWGTLFPDEWYTLSMNEWYYLLNTRTNAANLKQLAKIGDVYGVLLFPDDWTMPYDVTTPSQDEYNRYSYSLEDWQKLETAGAVFLPAAGRRSGADQVNTNHYTYYWTSTKETPDKVYYLINCHSLGNDQYKYALPELWHEKGLYGQSVRLARKLMPLQVVEWKENSVVVMYNGDPAQTATVTINNKQKGTAILSEVAKDIAVYELPATDLASSPNQPLEIAIGTAKVTMTIPYIATTTTTNVPNNSDLVILKDATFTATNEQLRNVTVYGGGELVVGEGATLSTNSLTLRIGGVTADGNYDYVYPQFLLKGTWSNTSGKINLDYLTTKEQYYTFVTPFAVNTKDIKYPVDIYGSNVAPDNTGSFEFQYYDGAARAEGNTGWTVVPEGDDGANLEAGQGYTFLGMPKKINGTRQKYGIHRIPMSVSAADAMSHEKTDQTISVAPHPSAKNNNSGWNLIGNPYMATIGGLTNEDIQVGELVHTNDANGNWTGGWHWDDQVNGQRFLVFPSNDGLSYEAQQSKNALLPAFKNFFVQIGNKDANALVIPYNKPTNVLAAPARRTEEVDQDIELAIVLEQDEAHVDQMDFLINNIYTEYFERDADFTKMMNATNLNLYGVHPYDNLSFVAIDNNTARGSVAIGYQVPQAGEYTLRMSDKPYIMWDKFEALYVTDHEMSPEVTTDIMSEPYRFTVANAETNHTRFTVSVILKVEEDDGGGDVGTGVDNTTNNNTPCKFIYQDKMYILRNGVIYDAMGKQVQTINK